MFKNIKSFSKVNKDRSNEVTFVYKHANSVCKVQATMTRCVIFLKPDLAVVEKRVCIEIVYDLSVEDPFKNLTTIW